MSKLIRHVKNNRGTTLVEMLATFVLLAIFLVAATRIISYTIGIYYVVKGNTNGYQVTNIIYDRVSGIVENAVEKNPVVDLKDNTIQLMDYDGRDAKIMLKTSKKDGKNYLDVHYGAFEKSDDDSDKNLSIQATDWYYDESSYLGYSIEKLAFYNPNEGKKEEDYEYPSNVVCMDIVVTHPRYGEYESKYYLKCFNCSGITYNE